MKPVLDAIEHELVVALRRRVARKRRRRVLTIVVATGLAALALAGIGIGAVTNGPIERLLNSDHSFARDRTEPRIDLHVTDPGGLDWTLTSYVSVDGLVSGTAAPAGLGDRFPGVGGANGFVIADNLLNGPLAGLGLNLVRHRGEMHYFFGGMVAEEAREVSIVLGGERRAATLSHETITVPVERPSSGLTAIGRARAARMPDQVTIRSYATTFTPGLLAGKRIVRATITITLADGSRHVRRSGPLCVSSSCGYRTVAVP